MFKKRLAASLMSAAALLYFLPLGYRALWDSDEGRYAEIAREMLELRDWITPHLNYVVYFEKPPLMYWLTALSMAVFGQNAFAARFCCAMFGVLTVGLVTVIGRRWKSERVGLLAGAILATSLLFFALTQFLVLDMALTFWTTLELLAASQMFQERLPERVRRYTWLFAVAGAGGFVTKGPIALFLPFMAITITALFTRSKVAWQKMPWRGALILGALLAAPWFVLAGLRQPFFWPFFFIHEHFARYLTNVHHRTGPLYYFVPVLLVGFLPWTFFLPRVAWSWLRHGGAQMKRDPAGALYVFWTVFIFVFFSLSHSKLIGYILPLLPALALLLAAEWDAVWESEPMPRWVAGGLAGLIIVFIAILTFIKGPLQTHSFPDPSMKLLAVHSGGLALVLAFAVFVLVGVWGMRKTRYTFVGIVAVQAIFLVSVAVLSRSLDAYFSTRALAQTIAERAQPEDRLAGYGVSYENVLQTLPFYARRRVIVLGDPGELALGFQHAGDLGDWFTPEASAAEGLAKLPGGSWIVTDAPHWAALQQGSQADVYTLVESQGLLRLLQKNL